jgi:outer membrane immunogenic protein
MTIRSFLLGAAALAVCTPALAQQPTARSGQWQGVYIGGHVGGAMGRAAPGSTSGMVAGGHIGVNGQFDRVILGIEADAGVTSNGSSGFGAKFRQGNNGSMRGRLGWSFDRVMAYATAGVAVSDYEYRTPVGKASRMRSGTVIGGGAELQLTDNISVRGELLHYNFARTSFAGIGGPSRVQPKNNVLRGGLSYRF